MYKVCQLEGICKVVVGGITGKDLNEQGFHGIQNKNVCGENLNEKEYCIAVFFNLLRAELFF